MGKKLRNNRMLSAFKHGVTAGILPHEQRAWRQHLQAVRVALQPVGPVEEALVERVALAVWRLRRVARWEAALITEAREKAREPIALAGHLSQESAPPYKQAAALSVLEWSLAPWVPRFADSATILAEAREHLAMRRAEAAVLERLLASGMTDVTSLDPDDAATVGWLLCDALDGEERAKLAAAWGVPPDEVGDVEPGPQDLLRLVELLGSERAREVLEEAHRKVRLALRSLEEGISAYEEATAERAARARPDLDELGKLQRYEAHLERVLYRALHELEARQARRRGESAPLAQLEVYGVEGDHGASLAELEP